MTEISISPVGCTEACPVAEAIEMALDERLEDTRDLYRQAQRKHESDGPQDDLGKLNIAKITKEHEERVISAQTLGCQALAKTCDGVHCVLAKYLAEDVVKRGDLPR